MRTYFVVTLCTLALCGPAWSSPLTEESPEWRARYQKMIMGGIRTDPACFALLDVLETDSRTAYMRTEIIRLRGECQRRAGRFDDALATCKKLLAMREAPPFIRLDAMRAVAETHWLSKRHQQAIESYRDIVRELKSIAGKPMEGEQRWIDLVSWLRVAAPFHIATLHEGRRDLRRADKWYRAAIEENTPPREAPNIRGFTRARAAMNLAVMYARESQNAKALDALADVRRYDPDFQPAYVEDLSLDCMKIQPAAGERIRSYKHIIKTYPEDPWVNVVRSKLFYALDEIDRDEAIPVLLPIVEQEARVDAPYGGLVATFEVDAYKSLIYHCLSRRKYERANDLLEQVLERYARHPDTAFIRETLVPRVAGLLSAGEASNSAPDFVKVKRAPEPEPEPRAKKISPLWLGGNLAILALAAYWFVRRKGASK